MFYLSVGCCCEFTPVDPCLIVEDTFSVADTTTPPNTTEHVGNWTITSAALHPDHADTSLQRIRFDDAEQLPTDGAEVEITIQGASGDQIGPAFLSASASNMYVEAKLTFGGGTSGRLALNKYLHAGTLAWSHTIDDECAVNEYDFPADEPLRVELCTQQIIQWGPYTAFPDARVHVARIYSGSTLLGEVGYTDHFPSETFGSGIWGGVTTGPTVATATGDDFSFSKVFAKDFGIIGSEENADCYVCPSCANGPIDLERTEQVSGTWTIGTPSNLIMTSDTNAVLLWDTDRTWVNANQGWYFSVGQDGFGTFYEADYRLYLSDTLDSYFEISTRPSATPLFYTDISLVIDGVEQHAERLYLLKSLAGFLTVWDCGASFTALGGNFFFDFCLSGLSIERNGRWGIGTGSHVLTDAPFYFASNYCSEAFDCDDPPDGTLPPDEGPDPPDPGDLSCCDPADGIAVGSTCEFTLNNLNILPSCVNDPCIGDLVTFLIALNSTHTLTCIYAQDETYIFFLDTGLDPPCESTPSGVTMQIRVYITREGDQCKARVELWARSVCIIWLESSDLKELDESCDGFGGGDLAGFGDAEDCCIDITGVSWSLDFS